MEWVEAEALTAGFDLAGIAPAPHSSEPEGESTAARFSSWIEDGRAGDMEYLKRRDQSGELLRRLVQVAIPWARSVLVCALNYNAAGPNSVDVVSLDPTRTAGLNSIDTAGLDSTGTASHQAGWIGRYAWSGDEAGRPVDYHDDLLKRLRMVEAGLRARSSCETRCYVDTGPLLERDFAARAGVGWVGKNTCILNQQLGSWLLLGVIVTSLALPSVDGLSVLASDRCGSCTRCLDSCPTGALVAPREMDASRCISYLTIEKKGSIAEELRAPMGRQVFGCDICQDVCPWNTHAPIASKPGLRARPELINPPLDWLAALDGPEFKRQFAGSPLERTKLSRLHRNVAIAMGNSADTSFIPRLQQWAEGSDPVLAESAAWALQRLQPDRAKHAGEQSPASS